MKIMSRVLDSLGLFEEEELGELEGAQNSKKTKDDRGRRGNLKNAAPVQERSLEPVRLVSSRRSRLERDKRLRPASQEIDEPRQRSSSYGAPQAQVLLAAPKNFESAQEIADYMRDGQPVLMNFEGTDYDIARRIVDFISGVAYAMGGNIKKVGQGVFLCAPHEVEVTYDVRSKFKGPDSSAWDEEDFERYVKG